MTDSGFLVFPVAPEDPAGTPWQSADAGTPASTPRHPGNPDSSCKTGDDSSPAGQQQQQQEQERQGDSDSTSMSTGKPACGSATCDRVSPRYPSSVTAASSNFAHQDGASPAGGSSPGQHSACGTDTCASSPGGGGDVSSSVHVASLSGCAGGDPATPVQGASNAHNMQTDSSRPQTTPGTQQHSNNRSAARTSSTPFAAPAHDIPDSDPGDVQGRNTTQVEASGSLGSVSGASAATGGDGSAGEQCIMELILQVDPKVSALRG
jgi:hypothetical protein